MGGKNCKALMVLLCCWLASCKKDTPEPAPHTVPTGKGLVYVVCEGNFGTGDATLYAYMPMQDSVYGDLYKNANNQPLGDVFQSMTKIGNNFFLCINNSDKIAVVDAGSVKLSGTINMAKPRYILPISSTKAYVSTLFSNKVYIINPKTQQVTGNIDMPNLNPEGMCLYYNDAFICTWDTAGNKIYKVDITTDKIAQAVTIAGNAPQEILEDKEQMLWVLSGNQPEGKSAKFSRIDPSTGEVLVSYSFPANADPLKPVFNVTKDTIYFIEADYSGGTANNGIYRMGIHDPSIPVQAFIAAKQYQYFWALGIDPTTGNIYVGDPKGFTQKGSVYIYRTDGTQTGSFNVGVGPGHFYFGE